MDVHERVPGPCMLRGSNSRRNERGMRPGDVPYFEDERCHIEIGPDVESWCRMRFGVGS